MKKKIAFSTIMIMTITMAACGAKNESVDTAAKVVQSGSDNIAMIPSGYRTEELYDFSVSLPDEYQLSDDRSFSSSVYMSDSSTLVFDYLSCNCNTNYSADYYNQLITDLNENGLEVTCEPMNLESFPDAYHLVWNEETEGVALYYEQVIIKDGYESLTYTIGGFEDDREKLHETAVSIGNTVEYIGDDHFLANQDVAMSNGGLGVNVSDSLIAWENDTAISVYLDGDFNYNQCAASGLKLNQCADDGKSAEELAGDIYLNLQDSSPYEDILYWESTLGGIYPDIDTQFGNLTTYNVSFYAPEVDIVSVSTYFEYEGYNYWIKTNYIKDDQAVKELFNGVVSSLMPAAECAIDNLQ